MRATVSNRPVLNLAASAFAISFDHPLTESSASGSRWGQRDTARPNPNPMRRNSADGVWHVFSEIFPVAKRREPGSDMTRKGLSRCAYHDNL
jgi:hypothetical protein